MNWFFGPRLPDGEVQQRFPPEAMQAVFSLNNGDIRYLKAPLDAMSRSVDTSSSAAQRALLRELKISGVVGFAATLLLVYGQRDDTFNWCCEVLRLVHLIEEDSNDVGGEGIHNDSSSCSGAPTSPIIERDRNSVAASSGAGNGEGSRSPPSSASHAAVSSTSASSSSLPPGQQQHVASSSLACCVVPLLRAAASRYTDAEVMRKYSALIVSAALMGMMPDHGADVAFSTHATLALQIAQRLLTHLSADDCAQCASGAALFLLSCSRHHIERFFMKESDRALWCDAAILSLRIVQRASTYVRPKGISRITRALEHVLRHFHSGDDATDSVVSNSSNHRHRSQPASLIRQQLLSSSLRSTAAGGSSSTSSATTELRTALGQLVGEAARVVQCAANDGWLPISRTFFDRLVGAASASLQDPEIISTGAFAACFSSLPRVSTVALRGGAISAGSDILPSVTALWDNIDRLLVPDAAATANRDALVSVADGLAAWLAEFHIIEPLMEDAAAAADSSLTKSAVSVSLALSLSGVGSDDRDQAASTVVQISRPVPEVNAEAKVEQRRIVWGTLRQKILSRVEETTLLLIDESLSLKRRNSDAVMASWFSDMWKIGFFFALLREAANNSNSSGSSRFIVEIRQRQPALLRFVQSVAASSCPELLQFLHLIPTAQNNVPSASTTEAAAINLEDTVSSTTADTIAAASSPSAAAAAPSAETDLLRRLLDRCRTTRRGTAPPDFIARSLTVLGSNPCPICNAPDAAEPNHETPNSPATSFKRHHHQHHHYHHAADFVQVETEDDDDDYGDGASAQRGENNVQDAGVSKLERELKAEMHAIEHGCHIANIALSYRLASPRTLHRLVQIMAEAYRRLGEHSGWQLVGQSALRLFSGSVFTHSGHRLCADVEIVAHGSTTVTSRVFNLAEMMSLYRLSPYLRMSPCDFYRLSTVFTRGRGWFTDDRAVALIRNIFDQRLIRALWTVRHDLVARCIVNRSTSTFSVTVPLVPSTSSPAAASRSELGGSTVTVVVTARFVRWVFQHVFVDRYYVKRRKAEAETSARQLQQQQQQQQSHILRRALSPAALQTQVESTLDLVMRFLFPAECPKDFDSFAALILASSASSQ